MNNETKVKDDEKINHEIGTKDEITKKDETEHKMGKDKHPMTSGSYARFGAMVGTSTIVMFGLMYLNTYALDHVYFSETRFYMMFVMGAVMAVIMLLFMLNKHLRKSYPVF
jgi:hypothetical protein